MNHSSKLKTILSAVADVQEVVATALGFRITCDNKAVVIATLKASGWKAKESHGFVVAWL